MEDSCRWSGSGLPGAGPRRTALAGPLGGRYIPKHRRPIDDADAETILNAVLDHGITFVDTANDYGRSEEYIGRYLAHRRNEYVLATKCGCTVVRKNDTTDDTPQCGRRRTCSAGCTRAWTGCAPITST